MAIAAGIAGALIQGSAARKAASSQEAAANKDIAFQKETRDIIRNDLAPYREGGTVAQSAYDFELGLGERPMIGGTAPQIETFKQTSQNALAPRPLGYTAGDSTIRDRLARQPTTTSTSKFRVNGQVFDTRQEAEAYAQANMTGGTAYGGYTKTPGYDFRLKQGQDSLEASAAARGGLYSGAAMKSALEYGQDYGTSEYGNYMNRLAGRADSGMAAAQMSGAASQQAASGVSNALNAGGNAKAAGYIGQGIAINDGIQNVLGAWNYQKNIPATVTGSGAGTVGSLWR